MLTLGIFGNGQLARYLALAGQRLGHRVTCWPQDPTSPAGRVLAAETDHSSLRAWIESCSAITFENEFLTAETAQALEHCSEPQNIFPPLEQIMRLKSKLEQKILLQQAGAPVPDFSPVSSLEAAKAAYRNGKVLKWAELGYDGKGVLLPTADESEFNPFWNQAQLKRVVIYAEDWIDWDAEVAQLVVRSKNGEIKLYPLCRTEQKRGICTSVHVPATEFGIALEMVEQIQNCARRIAEQIQFVGCLAVECFVSRNRFWVNELAPRVHNSGHFSLNAALTDQFENHLRAGIGLDLGKTQTSEFCGMWNLLGRRNGLAESPSTPPVGELYWYDKEQESIGRKLGHVNWVAVSREHFEIQETKIKQWLSQEGYL